MLLRIVFRVRAPALAGEGVATGDKVVLAHVQDLQGLGGGFGAGAVKKDGDAGLAQLLGIGSRLENPALIRGDPQHLPA